MLVKDNKYIPQQDKDFFILLRTGLWQTVTEPLSAAPDWPYIYKLACEQTVQGIVADGVAIYRSKYPQTQVPQKVMDDFFSQTAQIVRRNYIINQKQAEICQLLHTAGIPFYVVKGQEAAKNYPKPMLRCSGDIDYLIPIDQFQAAKDLLASKADRMEDENDYLVHVGLFFGDIEVELHGSLHPNLGDRIDKVIDKAQEDLFKGVINYETFNTIYIFLHCLQHFHWSGLGIRQITDWCMLLASSKDVDYNRVQQAIASMGIQTEWDVFLSFCKDWLGEEGAVKLSRSLNHLNPSQIWHEAKAGGNMGHHKAPKERISNTLIRVTSAWINIFITYFKHKSISPNISRTLIGVQFNEYRKQL